MREISPGLRWTVPTLPKSRIGLPPSSLAACCRRSGLRAVRMTSAPSARARRAVSSPMPALPPITTTVCPSSSGSCWAGETVAAVAMAPPMTFSASSSATAAAVLFPDSGSLRNACIGRLPRYFLILLVEVRCNGRAIYSPRNNRELALVWLPKSQHLPNYRQKQQACRPRFNSG